jgi:hypothetical protein
VTVVPAMPEVSERVRALHARMTLAEKLAQLVGFWVDQGGEVVAPMQGEMASSGRLEEATAHGIGHLTRVNGTRPVDPAERAAWLWREQRRLRTQTRLGIPALVSQHESPELIRTLSLTGRDPLSTAGRVPTGRLAHQRRTSAGISNPRYRRAPGSGVAQPVTARR